MYEPAEPWSEVTIGTRPIAPIGADSSVVEDNRSAGHTFARPLKLYVEVATRKVMAWKAGLRFKTSICARPGFSALLESAPSDDSVCAPTNFS